MVIWRPVGTRQTGTREVDYMGKSFDEGGLSDWMLLCRSRRAMGQELGVEGPREMKVLRPDR